MNPDNKKRLIIWIVIGVVVALVIVFLSIRGGSSATTNTTLPGNGTETTGVSVSSTQITESQQPVAGPVPNNPSVPQQSGVITKEELPKGSIALSVSEKGFEPKEFTVTSGSVVTLGLTATDGPHVLAFDNPSLSSVVLAVGIGTTKAINFTAPTKPGEYTFRCDLPGHIDRGEVGKMTVK